MGIQCPCQGQMHIAEQGLFQSALTVNAIRTLSSKLKQEKNSRKILACNCNLEPKGAGGEHCRSSKPLLLLVSVGFFTGIWNAWLQVIGLKMWMCEWGLDFGRVRDWRQLEMPGYSCVCV